MKKYAICIIGLLLSPVHELSSAVPELSSAGQSYIEMTDAGTTSFVSENGSDILINRQRCCNLRRVGYEIIVMIAEYAMCISTGLIDTEAVKLKVQNVHNIHDLGSLIRSDMCDIALSSSALAVVVNIIATLHPGARDKLSACNLETKIRNCKWTIITLGVFASKIAVSYQANNNEINSDEITNALHIAVFAVTCFILYQRQRTANEKSQVCDTEYCDSYKARTIARHCCAWIAINLSNVILERNKHNNDISIPMIRNIALNSATISIALIMSMRKNIAIYNEKDESISHSAEDLPGNNHSFSVTDNASKNKMDIEQRSIVVPGGLELEDNHNN